MCNEQKKPHVHAALIKAWADGAIIQVNGVDGSWVDVLNNRPHWIDNMEYRIKPEPEPDFVRYARIDRLTGHQYWCKSERQHDFNVIYTFDGETVKLKKVELIG
jgi:hypothetical protein